MRSSAAHGPAGQARSDTYRSAFRLQVIHLLLLGYKKLAPDDNSKSDEEAITGRLSESIREVIETEDAPHWAWRFQVHNETPLEGLGATGKSRPRVDIVLQRSTRGRHPRFHFEAKRLCGSRSVAEYVGENGLGCLTSGKYASGEKAAGMLGYVQTDDQATWAQRISRRMAGARDACRLAKGSSWEDHSAYWMMLVNLDVHAYETQHARQGSLSSITVIHLLLDFVPR
jgi:hypothetical protein